MHCWCSTGRCDRSHICAKLGDDGGIGGRYVIWCVYFVTGKFMLSAQSTQDTRVYICRRWVVMHVVRKLALGHMLDRGTIHF